MKPILFYRVSEPYGEFSNFSPYPLEINGRRWPTAEHFFQAQKFTGTEYEGNHPIGEVAHDRRPPGAKPGKTPPPGLGSG